MLSKRYESTEVDRRTWLHVPSGTLWSTRNNKGHFKVPMEWQKLKLLFEDFKQIWNYIMLGFFYTFRILEHAFLVASKIEVPRDVRNSKGPQTWQVQERMVSTLEQMQVPKRISMFGHAYFLGLIITRPGSYLDQICLNKAILVKDLGHFLSCPFFFLKRSSPCFILRAKT